MPAFRRARRRRGHFAYFGHRLTGHLLLMAIAALHAASDAPARVDGPLVPPPPPPPGPPGPPGAANPSAASPSGSNAPAADQYRPRKPLAAPPSAILKYLRSLPLTIQLAERNSLCCDSYLLRNATTGTWAVGEDVKGKPGLMSHNVSASVAFAVSGDHVRAHLRMGIVQVSVLESYERVGTMRVRLLEFLEQDVAAAPTCAKASGCNTWWAIGRATTAPPPVFHQDEALKSCGSA